MSVLPDGAMPVSSVMPATVRRTAVRAVCTPHGARHLRVKEFLQ